MEKKISIVPISARTGVGIPELFAVLVGLTQNYLKKKLDQEEKPTRGIVLEVNDEVGFRTYCKCNTHRWFYEKK